MSDKKMGGQMDYISLFSGIEAASVAWDPLGWNPVAFAEVESFPCAVLAARYPGVPNLGDVTEVNWKEWNGRADIVVGGSPCQSFSIAGLRKGLADPRGDLMLTFLGACRDIDPEWVVWENVPGVLSADGGGAFKAFVEAVAHLWPRGGVCWRVLDAQFFGVAQRRRRVFAVVNTRDWRRAAAVLLEPGCLRGDNPSSREKRQALAVGAARGAGAVGFPWHNGASAHVTPRDTSPGIVASAPPAVAGMLATRHDSSLCADRIADAVCLTTANTGANGSNASADRMAYTLDQSASNAVCYNEACVTSPANRSAPRPGDPCGTLDTEGRTLLCVSDDQARASVDEDLCGSLKVGGGSPFMAGAPGLDRVLKLRHTGTPNAGGGEGAMVGEGTSYTLATSQDQTLFQGAGDGYVVRRLTPVECERLQGFPDGWTDLAGWAVSEEAVAAVARGIEALGKRGGALAARRRCEAWGRETPDSPRYRALGNSMAVPVVRWVGERIEAVDELVADLMLEGGL